MDRKGLILLLCSFSLPALAGKADVLKVDVEAKKHDRFEFSVTVRHADSGWAHYANNWSITGPDGKLIAKRTLWHPHVHEQPFTRSLSNVYIPKPISWVKIHANDLVHGSGGRTVTITLPNR